MFAFWGMRIDGLIVQQVALCVETNHLASRAIPRVDAHYPFLSQRRSQEQLTEVSGKDTDGFLVGFFLAEGGKFGLDAGLQQTLVGITHGFFHLLATFIVATDIASFQTFGTFFVVGRDAYFQKSFGFSTADGQESVRGTSLQRLAEVEIILVLGSFLFLALHHFGSDDGLSGELVAELVARTLVLAHLFGDDVAGTLQGIVFILHLSFNEGTHTGHQVVFPLHHQDSGQWFQAFLTGSLGTGFPLGFVGEVDVFQLGGIPASLDALLQLVGQFALFLDGLQDGLLALGHFAQLVVAFLDFSDLHFIQSACRFLAVAADEGYGGSPVEQGESVFYLSHGNIECRCYHFAEYFHFLFVSIDKITK